MKSSLICAFLLGSLLTVAQNRNLSYLSNYKLNTNLSGLWGYTDETGREYALVGLVGGSMSVVDITSGTNPVEVFRSPAPSSNWREIKTFRDVAYVSTEGGTGIQIVDLSGLPQNKTLPYHTFTGDGLFTTVHTIWIDEDGLLYVWGSNGTPSKRGYLVYDLKPDPMNPTFYYTYTETPYIHDGFIRGNRMYLSHIYDGYFSVFDVTDKKNPVQLGAQITPNQFTHNTWPSNDGKYLFTTDERPNSFLTAYNISDPSNISEVDRIQTNPGSQSIIHNTHVLGDYAVTSYYTEGITIHDITDPENLIEVGKYDCSAFVGSGFHGVWEVYPFFPSGKVIASDIEGGLFVFQPTYSKGCGINGTVRDSITGQPLGGVNVSFTATSLATVTKADGSFKNGIGTPGNYSITLMKAGYKTRIIDGFRMSSGNTLVQDFNMVPANVGVEESYLDLVEVFPNPVNDQFAIQLNGVTLQSAELLSVDGKLIRTFAVDEFNALVSFDEPAGVYFLRLTEGSGAVQVRRLVKL